MRVAGRPFRHRNDRCHPISRRLTGTPVTPAMVFVLVGVLVEPLVFDDVTVAPTGAGVRTLAEATRGGVEDFHAETKERVGQYRRHRQDGQRVRLELWTEGVSTLDSVAPIAANYGVPCFSGGGQASVTAAYDAASRARRANKLFVQLHVGDWDPAGEVSIYGSFVADVMAFAAGFRADVEPERVALTSEQVKEFDLPTKPPKKGSVGKGWTATCELEALEPGVLPGLVEGAIRRHLDLDHYEDLLDAEAAAEG